MPDYIVSPEEQLKYILAGLPKKFNKVELATLMHWDQMSAGEIQQKVDGFLSECGSMISITPNGEIDNPNGRSATFETARIPESREYPQDSGKPVPFGDANRGEDIGLRTN